MLSFLFPPAPPRADYGPEWDPTFGTPQQNGGDNVWTPGAGGEAFQPGYGEEWSAGGYDEAWF